MGGDPVCLAEQGKQQVLSPDVIMVEVGRFFIGQLENFFDFSGKGRVSIDLDLRAKPDEPLDLRPDRIVVEVHVAQDVDGNSLTELHQPEKDVLSPQVVVVEALRLFLG